MYLWFFLRFVVEVSRVFHQLTELWSCCMQVMHKRGSVNFRLDPYLGCFHFNLNWLSLCVYTIALVVVRFLWRKCLESLIYLLVIYLYFFVILKTKKIFVSRWMQAICYIKNTFIVVEVFTYLMTILWFPTCYLIFHWKDCKRSSPYMDSHLSVLILLYQWPVDLKYCAVFLDHFASSAGNWLDIFPPLLHGLRKSSNFM